jgi:hypothetical protein
MRARNTYYILQMGYILVIKLQAAVVLLLTEQNKQKLIGAI